MIDDGWPAGARCSRSLILEMYAARILHPSAAAHRACPPSVLIGFRIASAEETKILELQNVTAGPISLLRSRYPSNYDPTKGKITTDVLVSLLVSFELLDEFGRKVNHPLQEIINDQTLGTLREIEIATIAPGDRIRCLLYPARTWQWLTAGLMPGQYSAVVQYHANRKLAPPQAGTNIWEGEVASAPASFRLGNGDQRISRKLIWGAPTKGLQAAVELILSPDYFVPGTQVDLRIYVRNFGTDPIHIRSEHWRQSDLAILMAEDGNERILGSSDQTGIPIMIRYILLPGQKVALDSGALGYQSNGQVLTKSHFPVIYHLNCAPGKYSIRYELGFHGEWTLAPDGRTVIEIPGDDWTGTVLTGAVPLAVSR